MRKLLLLRESQVKDLKRDIRLNLDKYRTGNFLYLESDSSNFLETDLSLDSGEIEKIKITEVDFNEVECCLAIHAGLKELTPYLARDYRLWVYLTHTILLDYTRNRWPIPVDDEKAIRHVEKHFFANGARGIERDNAASRLWWMAHICSKVNGLSLKDALTAFLHQSDVRANIVERPTTSQNVTVLSTVIKKLHESHESDKKLYGREEFRSVMRDLNLKGGAKLLEVLDQSEIENILDGLTS
jgi:hypothetical protein